jgi:hypothetical protein
MASSPKCLNVLKECIIIRTVASDRNTESKVIEKITVSKHFKEVSRVS